MAAQELRWLTYLLTDLGESPRSPPVLYVDNKAMLALCREQRLEHRTKHIALRYFLARELQQRGQLRLAYVASEANTADVFTKALAPCDHQRCCTQLGLLYFALFCLTGLELRWLTYLLTDLGERPRSPPVLYVDYKATIALCREQRLEHRKKHIALRYFFARESQQRGQLRFAYVASWPNTADIFTKAPGSGDHQPALPQPSSMGPLTGVGCFAMRTGARSGYNSQAGRTGNAADDAEISKWSSLPPELLREVIARLEEDDRDWPQRRSVVACAGVCKAWREMTRCATPPPCSPCPYRSPIFSIVSPSFSPLKMR
ncbi:unnamed protein product [Closterium sp. NIES-53]